MLRKNQRPAKAPKAPTIIVVSGLPRSGTSMMMKMLAEGGLPVVSDSIRSADEDNPNGYFEFEPVKALAEGRHDWLADADHKTVKIVSALLEHLPPDYHYKILFMERETKEILASQQKMLVRRSEEFENRRCRNGSPIPRTPDGHQVLAGPAAEHGRVVRGLQQAHVQARGLLPGHRRFHRAACRCVPYAQCAERKALPKPAD